MIKRLFNIIGLFIGLSIFMNGYAATSKTLPIIPYPDSVQIRSGHFNIDSNVYILYNENVSEFKKLAQQFADRFVKVSGIALNISDSENLKYKKTIRFEKQTLQNPEAYTLKISKKEILITAGTTNGAFYALQTLYQLLPPDIYSDKVSPVKNWTVPCVEITDSPRFAYRGMHLDVCRHFFPVEFIKKYIDALAIHKMNQFHWHLTDDQGWRIEIKKYPLLTQIGSKRVETLVGQYYENFPQRYDDEAYGGYYTQAEAREIVAYAAERFITVIPEIEMPGHAVAAIAAYPFLSCTRQPIKVATKWGVFQDVFCPRDTTFGFLEDVMSEITDIFPSKYIHIGGDECPKDRWKVCPDCQARMKSLGLKDEHELQSYFIQRIEKFLNSKGREIIGWDEILDGGIAPNATVMSWRGNAGGITAAQSGHHVIMTPNDFCYFDHYQTYPLTEPTAIGGFLPIEKVYSFQPQPDKLTPDENQYILGAQANVWTEYIKTPDQVEYMVFPRIAAMAEVLWSAQKDRSWERFRSAISTQFERYKALSLNPSKAFYDINCKGEPIDNERIKLTLYTDNPDSEIRYTTNGSLPSTKSPIYSKPLILNSTTEIKAQAFQSKKATGKDFYRKIIVSYATGLKYTTGNLKPDINYALTNGFYGDTKTNDNWVALGGNTDREVVIDLQQNRQIGRIKVGMLSAPGFRALYAPEIKVFTSADGVIYNQVASGTYAQESNGIWKILRPEFIFPQETARFVKLTFKFAGETTGIDDQKGNSFVFVDEIEIL
jgi:hexosaminidase